MAHLGRLAHHQAALEGRPAPDGGDIVAAAWTTEGGGLDALAEPLCARIPDDAVVEGYGLGLADRVLLAVAGGVVPVMPARALWEAADD